MHGLIDDNGDIWCVCGGGRGRVGTMDEPWCVFIGCYDSSFSNYRLLEFICEHHLPIR